MTDRIDLIRFQRAITTTANGTVVTGITAGANGSTSQLVMDSAGNVGIGISSPSARLHVVQPNNQRTILQSSAGVNFLRLQSSNGGGNFGSQIEFFDGATNSASISSIAEGGIWFDTAGINRARITSGGDFQFNSGYGSVATAFGCRAWVNFNGTGTVAIGASGNVSSITDNGTGLYTINFTAALADTSFAANVTSKNPYNSSAGEMIGLSGGGITTTTVQVRNATIGASYDANPVGVSIHR